MILHAFTAQSIPNLLNVDDADLLASPPIPKNIEVATASSFQVIRARVRALLCVWLCTQVAVALNLSCSIDRSQLKTSTRI